MGPSAEIMMRRRDEFSGRYQMEYASQVDVGSLADRVDAQGRRGLVLEQRANAKPLEGADG